jgi:autotransporter family porin
VKRSPWEPRPHNATANQTVPSASDLAYFLAHSSMPYKDQVTGAFTGTTDEILQWAARKHGWDPDLLRAVAAVESRWHMSANGDNGDSFGLFQMRRPFHCCDFLAAKDSGFNADYYAAIIRAYYDGRMTWLNTVSGNGRHYRSGDLWGSVGAWFSGRWRDAGAKQYVAKVKRALRERVWRQPGF